MRAAVSVQGLATPLVSAEELPPLLQEIADLVSVSAALTIALQLGGRRMYICRMMPPGHKLAQAVGLDSARVIADRYGGDYVVWPAAGRALRLHEARRLRRAGLTFEEIGKALGVHYRTVFRLIGGTPAGVPSAVRDGGRGLRAARAICPVCRRRHKPRRPADPRQLRLL